MFFRSMSQSERWRLVRWEIQMTFAHLMEGDVALERSWWSMLAEVDSRFLRNDRFNAGLRIWWVCEFDGASLQGRLERADDTVLHVILYLSLRAEVEDQTVTLVGVEIVPAPRRLEVIFANVFSAVLGVHEAGFCLGEGAAGPVLVFLC